MLHARRPIRTSLTSVVISFRQYFKPLGSQLSFALLLVVGFATRPLAAGPDSQCRACKDFVDTFQKGYDRTANSNFGGGNTDWEETRLGSYSTSETRLVEILEHACTEGTVKDQCHHFVELHEEQIEKWYFHLQNHEPDFEKWLCIVTAKVCCPPNTFGPDCKFCPGMVDQSGNPCYGRGECEGNTTRKGSGKCRCQKGYKGDLCDSCAYGFYQGEKNDTFIECKDINECEVDPRICPDSEYCYNTEGSYKCTKCHTACKGCTGSGAAKCRTCGEGYVLVDGSCTDEMVIAKDHVKHQREQQFGTRPRNDGQDENTPSGHPPSKPKPDSFHIDTTSEKLVVNNDQLSLESTKAHTEL